MKMAEYLVETFRMYRELRNNLQAVPARAAERAQLVGVKAAIRDGICDAMKAYLIRFDELNQRGLDEGEVTRAGVLKRVVRMALSESGPETWP